MKVPLCLGEGHQQHRQGQTKPERNTCTNPTETDRDIGTVTEFRQPIQVQSHLEMTGILVQLDHIQRT